MTPDDLARDLYTRVTGCQYAPVRYAGEDASGHEHLPAGSPEGGQFTGKAEDGQSPDDMASSFGGEENQEQADRVSSGVSNAAKEIAGHLAEYGEDDPNMPANLMNEIMVNADVDKADRGAVLDTLFNDGFLDHGEDSADENEVYVAGPAMKALSNLKEYAAEDPEATINQFQMQNIIGGTPEENQQIIDTLFNHGFLDLARDATGKAAAEDEFQIHFQDLTHKHRYADASGREHAPGGTPEGGQFTGSAEDGQSPDDMAANLGAPQAADAGKAAVASVQNYIDNITKDGASSAKIEEALAPLGKVPTNQLATVAAELKIAGRIKSRKALIDQIRQVMTNLSMNWTKYGPQSGA